LRAGLAVLARRPSDVERVLFAPALEPELRAAGVPGRVVQRAGNAELARAAGSTHHEGLCVLARPRRWTPASELADGLVGARGCAVALDRVRNPYNVGAILRTAAFFGVDAALLGAIAPHPALAPDAIRVAEGGVEHLVLARTTDLADTLSRLPSRGVAVVGAEGASPTSALEHRFAHPTVLVMGHEREGLSPRVRAQCSAIVSIPGSGAVESLNVAVAAGILLSQVVRTRSS
jgi:TrmH RNA methyltransferase